MHKMPETKKLCLLGDLQAGKAVTTVERFVMLGAVFIEVEPTSPSTVDPLALSGEMSAPVYSQWAFWRAYSHIICDSEIIFLFF